MSPKRIGQRFLDYKKALRRLKEVLLEDTAKTDAIIDGTIQRFEFCFELAWKLLKDVLHYDGIEVSSPRAIIKESFQKEFIVDGENWMEMLNDRNKTSHLYDEQEALHIYKKIKEQYYALLESFEKDVSVRVMKIQNEEGENFLK